MPALPTLTREERVGIGVFALTVAFVLFAFGTKGFEVYALFLAMYIVALGLGYGLSRLHGRPLAIHDGVVIAGVVVASTFLLQLTFTVVKIALHSNIAVSTALGWLESAFPFPHTTAIIIQVILPAVFPLVLGLATSTRQELFATGGLAGAFGLSLLSAALLDEGAHFALTEFILPTVGFAVALLLGIPLYLSARHLSANSPFEVPSQVS